MCTRVIFFSVIIQGEQELSCRTNKPRRWITEVRLCAPKWLYCWWFSWSDLRLSCWYWEALFLFHSSNGSIYTTKLNYKINKKQRKETDDSLCIRKKLLNSCSQIAHKFRTSKFLITISNLFTRQFKIELQTAKLYCLHIITVEYFHKETVNHEVQGAQLRLVQW